MKPNVKQAERNAAPERKTAPSLLGNLIYRARTQEEVEMISRHVRSMTGISNRFRGQMREAIRQYRVWRTFHEINDVHAFYLEVEGKMLRDHIGNLFRLYRDSHRDLLAIRRRIKNKS